VPAIFPDKPLSFRKKKFSPFSKFRIPAEKFRRARGAGEKIPCLLFVFVTSGNKGEIWLRLAGALFFFPTVSRAHWYCRLTWAKQNMRIDVGRWVGKPAVGAKIRQTISFSAMPGAFCASRPSSFQQVFFPSSQDWDAEGLIRLTSILSNNACIRAEGPSRIASNCPFKPIPR